MRHRFSILPGSAAVALAAATAAPTGTPAPAVAPRAWPKRGIPDQALAPDL